MSALLSITNLTLLAAVAAPQDAPAVTAQDLEYPAGCHAIYGGTGGIHLIKVICPKLEITSLTPALSQRWVLLSEDETSRLWLNGHHVKRTQRTIGVWLRLELKKAVNGTKFTDYLEAFDCATASGDPLRSVDYDAHGTKVGQAEDTGDLWMSLLSPTTAAIVRSRFCTDFN